MSAGRLLISVIFVSVARSSFSQAPISDFTGPTSICINQQCNFLNNSSNASSYIWDFCFNDLSSPVGIQLSTSVLGVPGISFVFAGDNWYGFLTSWNDNTILRLDYGVSLENTPNITDLGNIGGLLNGPQNLEFIQEGGTYYAILSNFFGGNLIRLNFLSGINSMPTADNLGGLGGAITNLPRGMNVVKDGSNYVAAVSVFGDNNVTLINFGASITNNPAPSDVINVISTISQPIGVRLINDGVNWFGFVSSYGSDSLIRLTFGSSLSGSVTQSNLASISNPTELVLLKEGDNYDLFSATESGSLYIIQLGPDPSGYLSMTNLGNFGVVNNSFALSIQRSSPIWYGFTADLNSGNVYRIKFQGSCPDVSIPSSVSTNPTVTYFQPGNYFVELSASSSFAVDVQGQDFTVQNLNAPEVTIENDNNCVSSVINFSAAESTGLAVNSYSWTFGDGSTSPAASPDHTYATASSYNVSLDVIASNGCGNNVQKNIGIFNPPQANFDLPSTSPICSNQSYLFSNASTFDSGSNPTWQWIVNGTNVGTAKDLSYSIPSVAVQNVTLTASILGCSSQSTQSIINVQDGPLVNFNSPSNGCVASPASFTNASTGTITSYNWDFGDGNTSSQTNGSNNYVSTGIFPVTLTASNTAGCQNFLTKNFSVYSNPAPDFAIEAPPFSCANYPAQFDNNTPPPSDSNITTWAWNFGDAASGTSNMKNPSYIYSSASSYNVTLQATTNFGCTGTAQQNVTIYPSPQAGFTNTPACVNQGTVFSDASSGNISSYQWLIQGSVLSGPNPPPYVFKSSGTFPVTLTTVANSGCKNQAIKSISVPVPPVMDFTYGPPCTGKPTIFQELNPGGPDPSVAWNWNFGAGSAVGSPSDYSFTAAGVYLVTLSATRNSGCIYSTSKNVAIYDGPIANFAPSVDAGPSPLPVTFNNSSTADSYFWQFGDPLGSTSAETSPEFTYTQLGLYKALLTASNVHGCNDTLSAKIYVVIPRVDLAMNAFTLIEDPTNNSSKAVVTISNLGNIPSTNPEVLIDLGGNASLKENMLVTVLPGKSVQQTLSLEIVPQTLGYICAEVAPLGDVNVYNDRQCISLTGNDILYYPYPNPADRQISFDWIASETENVTVRIYKSTGQVSFEQNFQMLQSGINQLAIDVSLISSGLYLIEFSGLNTKKTFSIMVVHE